MTVMQRALLRSGLMAKAPCRFRMVLCCSLLLLAISLTGFANAGSAAQSSEGTAPRFEISLLTFSPTDHLFEWFGHTALAVTDLRTGKSVAYNFGGFSFGTDDFLMFTMGRFVFWSYTEDTGFMIRSYRRKGRHIIIQRLDLTRRQTNRIRRSLMRAMLPANRYYNYDHFKDNCATRLRDIVDNALSGAIRNQSADTTGRSYRDYVHRMTAHLPALDFLINFILSDGVDRPITYWQTMFLPDRLMAVFQNVSNPQTGRSLVRSREEIVSRTRSAFFSDNGAIPSTVVRDRLCGLIQFLLFALAGWFYVRRRKAERTWRSRVYPLLVSIFGTVYGLLGVVLFFMAVIGSHKDVYWNENFFLLNPLTLLLLPFGLLRIAGKAKRPFAVISVLCGAGALLGACLKVLPSFDQANAQQLTVLLPSLLIIAICGFRDLRGENQPHNSHGALSP